MLLPMIQPPHYTGAPLDRADHLREDAARFLSGPDVRILPFWQGRHALDAAGAPVWRRTPLGEAAVFLGLAGDTAWFMEDLSHLPAVDGEDRDLGPGTAAEVPAAARWIDLRGFGNTQPRDVAGVLAYGRGLMFWHQNHRFCGRCGAPTEVRKGGHQRQCTNADCAAPHFPRTDPAVIMLVSDGDRVLLGRQAWWPPGALSTLAGFVEPGETLEEAVAREVQEEAGVVVRDVVYRGSQPWPFPSSLMLGFWATAETTDIHIDRQELETACWVHRDELAGFGEWGDGTDRPKLPRADSISRWLIETWRTR
ncbi:NAD+ diphosphatase [Caenispirillum bisanense]|uniref:NAD(+) diphosphatase n=2 Tax=Caenispirillum bisanense TaxID=414052 RepID=A0A286GUW4_9PROT|nr:NAD+ diphosphatase [Caenispirillum bisanense]